MSKARTMSNLLTSSGDVITTALDNVGAAITAGSGIALGDNDKATFGAGDDLQIYHDGSNNWVKGNNAGNNTVVVAPGGTGSVLITNSSGDNIITQQGDVAMLHHNGATKLATKATGVTVTGEMAATTMDLSSNAVIDGTALVTGVLTTTAATVHNGGITMPDDAKALFGTGSDLEIYHDGSNSYIHDSGTGSLNLRGTDLYLRNAANEVYVICASDGAVSLRYDNVTKLATKATGVTVTGEMAATTIAASGAVTTGPLTTTGDINLSGELNLNAASNNYIDFTDALHIRAAGSSPAYEDSIYCLKNAQTVLMYNGAGKINTTNTGVGVTGDVVASGNVTAYSDLRIKDNLEVIPDALSKVEQLNGYTYTRTDSEDKQEKHTGVIAQEVLKVLPEAVVLGETPEDNMAVAYGNMVGLLIEAVKELSDKVKELEENQNGFTK
jgi:hypothetical protein